MSAARGAVAAVTDAGRSWREVQERTRSSWNDVVRTHFDQMAAERLTNAMHNGVQAVEILDTELDSALAMLEH